MILHCSLKPCPPPACLGDKGGAAVQPGCEPASCAVLQRATWTIKGKLALKVEVAGLGERRPASEQGVRDGGELHSAWGWERILLNPKEMFP